ncbi:MAG: hypothetical protein KKA73_18120 [Chloroflexi bacterium]|nr:hypothetical protein [Chloroflexota bacterium]
MPFTCPACSTWGALRITTRLELAPDSRSDEIALQVVKCSRCDFAGIAVYEESRRGPLGDESFDHTGYRVSREDLQALRKAMRQCPRPKDARCTCATHRTLGHKNAAGRWDALDDVPYKETFRMEL